MTVYILLLGLSIVAAIRGLWSPCGLSTLSSLNPVAERARGHRFWVTACWYVAGSLVGGLLLGGAFAVGAGAFGAVDAGPRAAWWLVLAGALVAVASDARLGGWSLPMHPRQVDERWLTKYRRWIYAGGYGVQIGTGFATYIMTAAVYLMALLAIATGAPRQALVAGAVFGLARGLTSGLAAPARDPDRLRTVLARVDALAQPSARAAALACVLVAVVAGAQLGGVLPAALVALGTAWLLFRRTSRRAGRPGRARRATTPAAHQPASGG